jgi:uncharacterized membrane protein YeiH
VPRLPAQLVQWLHVPDAIGLGLFSIVGAGVAVQHGASPFIAALFGVMTGTFGGVIGDIVVNEVPSLFRPTTPLYATCSFAGCWVFLLARLFTHGEVLALWAGVLVVVALRLMALRWDWRMPAPRG